MIGAPWTNATRQRFLALWRRSLGAELGSVDAVFQLLEEAYAELHRHYHGAAHIALCLEQHDLARREMAQPDEVELAIWFHDVVYRPGSLTNEADSAALFRRIAEGADPARIDRVAAMILATTHETAPDDSDTGFVVDIDLASLGMPWASFSNDSRLLRDEQPDLPESAFIAAQQSFLQKLIDRSWIYRTPFFRAHYEQRARANIARMRNSRAA